MISYSTLQKCYKYGTKKQRTTIFQYNQFFGAVHHTQKLLKISQKNFQKGIDKPKTICYNTACSVHDDSARENVLVWLNGRAADL